MELKTGYYKTRDGKKAYVAGLRPFQCVSDFLAVGWINSIQGIKTWTRSGSYDDDGFPEHDPQDLVEEWSEPEHVPLGPEDVPPGSAIRLSESTAGWWMIESAGPTGVYDNGRSHFTWDYMQGHCDIKRPGDGWTDCWKDASPE